MWIWNAVSVGIGLLTLFGVYYTYAQVRLLRDESRTKTKWATKHAEAFALVAKAHQWMTFEGSQTSAYHAIFSDPELRQHMENYVVQWDVARNSLSKRALDGDHYCYPIVQDTITKTIEAVEKFKQEHPKEAARLGFK